MSRSLRKELPMASKKPTVYDMGVLSVVDTFINNVFEYESIQIQKVTNGVVRMVVLKNVLTKMGASPYRCGVKFDEVRIHHDGTVTLVNNKQTVTRRLVFSFSPYLLPEKGVQGNAEEVQ
jgi:hypothetical protein